MNNIKLKSFLEYLSIKEANDLESGTPTADLRVNRPYKYDYDREFEANLLHRLTNPANKDAITQVLKDHPELRSKLQKMINDAIMRSDDRVFDLWRLTPSEKDAYYDKIKDSANRKASDITSSF